MNSLKEQFEKETGWICSSGKQSSRRYIEWLEQREDHDWHFAHASLGRVYREIKGALPHCREFVKNSPKDVFDLAYVIMLDQEVRPEIELLIAKMVEDIENDS